MSKKKYPVLISIIIVLFIFLSCSSNVYTNKGHRYKINCPEGWVMVNSKRKHKVSPELLTEIMQERWYNTFEEQDVIFVNPETGGPIMESIKVNSYQVKLNLKNMSESISLVGQRLTMMLGKDAGFEEVRNFRADVLKFKKGEILRFDFSYYFMDEKYLSIFIVIPGRMYATYFIAGTCKDKDAYKFQTTYDKVIETFRLF